MNSPNDRRSRLSEDDASIYNPNINNAPHSGAGALLDTVLNDRQDVGLAHSEFTLMVAGSGGGKTSFLRLLLDTSDISATATKDQLAAVAKFVQGCSGHTNHIRTASVDIDVKHEPAGPFQHLTLSLIDTPSLNYRDEISAERLVSETLRYIDSRFAEGFEERKAQTGDRYIHLCIYFLDPDDIVPPSVPGPPAPLVPRARANSFSHQADLEPVILEPPVTNNPLLCRPTLPTAEINTIKRLSARVNVLPVIAKADMLSNDRLAAIKLAIRRDLAQAGIGFGIFDMDSHIQHGPNDEHLPSSSSSLKNETNGYPGHTNGSAGNTPPASPVTPLLRLPYALISPDLYSHSDGVPRNPPSRHELVIQYTPSLDRLPSLKIVRGRYIRSYRWGSLDVLDPAHSDFMSLRVAIFHHMETLQKYTREYLFDKFRLDCQPLQRPTSRHSVQQSVLQTPPHTMTALSHATRPILAIDTAPHPARHPAMSMSRAASIPGDLRGGPVTRAPHDLNTSASSSRASGSTSKASTRQRTKKINVACNFCRSRKLKCDGGRPACSQCVKRSNPCDYQPQNKRRGNAKNAKPDESESDSADDRSPDEEPSLSPEVPPQSLPRRASNVDKYPNEVLPPPSLPGPVSREDVSPSSLPPSSLPPSSMASSSRSKPLIPSTDNRMYADNELPHIATLLPDPPSAAPMSAPTLPAIRPASDHQAAQRKRSATVPGKTNRVPTTSGPKVVACNFCRARKTKCDGAHPACSSCARRQLPCNYVHDSPGGGGGGRKGRRASTASKPAAPDSPPSAQSSRMAPTPLGPDVYAHARDVDLDESELQSKRAMDIDDMDRPYKKAKMDVDGVSMNGSL